jgi:hypothetical protein
LYLCGTLESNVNNLKSEVVVTLENQIWLKLFKNKVHKNLVVQLNHRIFATR